MIEIPSAYAEGIVARSGDDGRRWIDGLGGVIASYLDRWTLVAEGPVWHGFVGVALPVTCADGRSAVLKVSWLDDESRGEPVALAAWYGRGAVMLLEVDDADDTVGVMLLERLDQAHSVRELDGESAAREIGSICRQLAVPAPPGLPRIADLAPRWIMETPVIWERLGRPMPRAVIDAAVATWRELGPDQPDLLLHGDLTFDNLLRSDRAPWLAIDPYGLVGEPAYDAAKMLTNRWSELAAQPDLRSAVLRRLAAFADGAEVDLDRARRWALARKVTDGLWCHEHQPEAAPYVEAIATILASSAG